MQETKYPHHGSVRLRVIPPEAREFGLNVRIPGWVRKGSVRVDGKPVGWITARSYLRLNRLWQPDSEVELVFNMPVERIAREFANLGKVAVQRGPIVCYLEGINHEGRDTSRIRLQAGIHFAPRFDPILLGGVTA